MLESILRPKFKAAVESFLAAPTETIEQLVQEDEVAAQIFQWLARLKMLNGVPFRYLVPDERMLPPESIRFFHIDGNWLNALLDGAYSIGRYAAKSNTNQLYNSVEAGFVDSLQAKVNKATRDTRTSQLGLEKEGSNEPFESLTGFLLRSSVVSGWKGLQANAYNVNNYPDLPDWDGTSLKMIRLERLSDQILIGIFEGVTYRLDIHEPSEGLHFGFDTGCDGQSDTLCKKLRNPINGESDWKQNTPTKNIISNAQLKTAFRDYKAAGAPDNPPPDVNQGGQVVNMYKLSGLLYNQLNETQTPVGYTQPVASVKVSNTTTPVSGLASNLNVLTSSDFAMQMVEGVGMVSFYNAAE